MYTALCYWLRLLRLGIIMQNMPDSVISVFIRSSLINHFIYFFHTKKALAVFARTIPPDFLYHLALYSGSDFCLSPDFNYPILTKSPGPNKTTSNWISCVLQRNSLIPFLRFLTVSHGCNLFFTFGFLLKILTPILNLFVNIFLFFWLLLVCFLFFQLFLWPFFFSQKQKQHSLWSIYSQLKNYKQS